MLNYFEHIQDYLDGVLSSEDHLDFQRQLSRDEALREETDHQRMLRTTIHKQLGAADGIPALEETLKTISDRHFSGRRRKKRATVIRWIIPVAAAACLLLVFNFMGWFATGWEELPDMPTPTVRGDTEHEAAFLQAAEAFNSGEYRESTAILAELTTRDTSAARYAYYLGLGYIGSKRYGEAVDALRPVADGTSVFAGDARYFLSVALWRTGRNDEAIVYARSVPPGSDYHEKSRKLVRHLTD